MPVLTRSSRSSRTALAIAAVAGVSVLAACGSGGTATNSVATTTPAASTRASTAAPASFKPPKRVFAVAREFIRTAVLRTDLSRSWRLTTSSVHQNLTEQQWLTGDIPIVPFPKADFLAAHYHLIRASRSEVVLDVLMVPRKGSVIMPTRFYMHLVSNGRNWLVNYWAPHGEGGGLPSINS